jgi:hypothetical protein
MEDLFRTIFEAFPKKSSIVFTGECSDCGQAISIEIVPTSGGFGLLGGALVEYPIENYVSKCRDCYKSNGKMGEQNNIDSVNSAILHKRDLLDSILANHIGMWKNA